MEAIGKVRHKNLVGLMGYCADTAQRLPKQKKNQIDELVVQNDELVNLNSYLL